MNSLTLYPSSWLYNAGVIGLLRVLEKAGGAQIISFDPGGSLTLRDLSIILSKHDRISYQGREFTVPSIGVWWLLESWEQLVSPENAKKSEDEKMKDEEIKAKKMKEVWGKIFNTLYRGFLNSNTNYLFDKPKSSDETIVEFSIFLESLAKEDYHSNDKCSFCLRNSNSNYKNFFTSEHFRELGASSGKKGVPNSFWNLSSEHSLRICDFCSFVLLNSHLAFTPLSDGSEIFINAPSFRVMYYLNRFARKVIGAVKSGEGMRKREILAMSVMEYAMRIHTTLGVWTGMNIELVSRREVQQEKRREIRIEFFSLPYEVTRLLADRSIASLLNRIGEFYILNLVLDRNFSRLIEVAYRLLRIGLKSKLTDSDNKFIREVFYMEKNRQNPTKAAQNIMKLYTLVEGKMKAYEYA